MKKILRFANKLDLEYLQKNDQHVDILILEKKIDSEEILLFALDDNVIGFLRFNYFWDEIPFMNMLNVEEKFRGKGYGKYLVNNWENLMRKKKYEKVMTSTVSNETAKIFYEKLGYKKIGGFFINNEPEEYMYIKKLENVDKNRQKKPNNYCFIDGQNLYQGVDWNIDYKKFRIYLKDKYNITKAYYFLGFKNEEGFLYKRLEKAGFILVFNLKPEHLKSEKKGNIDVNLVFYTMMRIIEEPNDFDKIVLVSGDGDYKVMVDYLMKKNRFLKILFPSNKFASSLYNGLSRKYYDHINNIRPLVEYKKRGS